MKKSGKLNPITGEEILIVEESDINFWDKTWEELTLEEKADFCSFIRAPYLATKGEFNNEVHIKARYTYFRLKNLTEL